MFASLVKKQKLQNMIVELNALSLRANLKNSCQSLAHIDLVGHQEFGLGTFMGVLTSRVRRRSKAAEIVLFVC